MLREKGQKCQLIQDQEQGAGSDCWTDAADAVWNGLLEWLVLPFHTLGVKSGCLRLDERTLCHEGAICPGRCLCGEVCGCRTCAS